MNAQKEAFFEREANLGHSHNFDNIVLRSGASDQVRKWIETGNYDGDITVPDISSPYTVNSRNNVPVATAAMDTVSNGDMGIIIADGGGRTTLHYGFTPEQQFKELEKVKKRLNGFIESPKKLSIDDSFERVHRVQEEHDFTNLPVIDAAGRLQGLLTKRQIERTLSPSDLVADRMIPIDRLKVSREMIGIEQAYQIMFDDDEINILPILGQDDTLLGMYTWADAKRIVQEKSGIRNVDRLGRYVCDIAVPTDEKQAFERVDLCKEYLMNGGGVIVVDTADGDGPYAARTIYRLLERYPGIDIMAGNITDEESAVLLARIGVHGVKVGQASGGACTTYEETGIGRGQVSAVWACRMALNKAGFEHIPLNSDGGIKKHGDLEKAIAVGASSGMVGTMFGATEESPAPRGVLENGAPGKWVRGMGSPGALIARPTARLRYRGDGKMPLAEGKEVLVPISGSAADELRKFRLALTKTLIYAGAVSIPDFQQRSRVELAPLSVA